MDDFVQGPGPDGRPWLAVPLLPVAEYLASPRWARWLVYLAAAAERMPEPSKHPFGELGKDRFAVTFQCSLFGESLWIETNEAARSTTGVDRRWVVGIDMLPPNRFDGGSVPNVNEEPYVRLEVDLGPYVERVLKAVDLVYLETGHPPEKITILDGTVAAHPPTVRHHRCPFCYPAGRP